eukprot:gene4065-4312_t
MGGKWSAHGSNWVRPVRESANLPVERTDPFNSERFLIAPSPESSNGSLVPSHEAGQDIRNLPAVQGAAPGKVNVQFVVPEYFTNWGQVLKVVGSLEELGNWKVEKAPQMTWHDGHTWTLDVQLPVGAINFKVVMQEPHGGVRWEQGTDRSVLIPQTTTATGAPVGQVGVTCSFNDVSNSRVEVRPDRDYLKQQLRAVEARVIAIQEKKRKLDQRMAVLTEGLKSSNRGEQLNVRSAGVSCLWCNTVASGREVPVAGAWTGMSMRLTYSRLPHVLGGHGNVAAAACRQRNTVNAGDTGIWLLPQWRMGM